VKLWVILLEDYNYTADVLFDIGAISCNEPFYHELSEGLREKWIQDGMHIEKRMIFNLHFLEGIEDFLIKNGVLFNFIKYKEDIIGIRIHPSEIDFDGILKDCMTLYQFQKNRIYMQIKVNNESK